MNFIYNLLDCIENAVTALGFMFIPYTFFRALWCIGKGIEFTWL